MLQRTRIAVRNLSLALAASGSLLAVATATADYPKPAPVPYKWELEFEPGPLRLYVDPSGEGAYWYFTYQVTNRTGDNQLWAPKFVLYTDAGEIIESGRNVPERITQDLLAMLGNDLLEDQNEALGDILQGRENAKEGLVIWRPLRLEANQITLFIAGMSGETARVKNPATSEEIILRKTLQRDYLVPGNAIDRGSKPVELVSQEWVLR